MIKRDTEMGKSEIIMKYEDKGRDKFQRLCETLNYDYENNSDITAHYDGTLHYKGRDYLVEIKDRNAKYESYDTVLLEAEKRDNIMRCVDDTGADGAYYACFYGDTAYMFNVADVAGIETTTMMCNRHTAFDDGKREKEIILIPKELGKVFRI